MTQGGDGQAHIRIAGSLVNTLRAEAPSNRPFRFASLPGSVVAGVCLSLSIVLMGFRFVRGRGASRTGASWSLLLVTAVVAGGVFGCVWGGKPPPVIPVKTRADMLRLNDYGSLSGEALLEIDNRTNTTEVLIDRDVLLALLEQPAPKAPENSNAERR
jgi:hypothetical protein